MLFVLTPVSSNLYGFFIASVSFCLSQDHLGLGVVLFAAATKCYVDTAGSDERRRSPSPTPTAVTRCIRVVGNGSSRWHLSNANLDLAPRWVGTAVVRNSPSCENGKQSIRVVCPLSRCASYKSAASSITISSSYTQGV